MGMLTVGVHFIMHFSIVGNNFKSGCLKVCYHIFIIVHLMSFSEQVHEGPDLGFSRECANLKGGANIFWSIFFENYVKMKNDRPRGRVSKI